MQNSLNKNHNYVTSYKKSKNKRAQKALGYSPEEKVKGQGEAIYRGPLINQILVEDF